LMDKVDDYELGKIIESRRGELVEAVEVNLDAL
jgi:antitoxin StbD